MNHATFYQNQFIIYHRHLSISRTWEGLLYRAVNSPGYLKMFPWKSKVVASTWRTTYMSSIVWSQYQLRVRHGHLICCDLWPRNYRNRDSWHWSVLQHEMCSEQFEDGVGGWLTESEFASRQIGIADCGRNAVSVSGWYVDRCVSAGTTT